MVKALVIAGYGLNCEEETAHAFSYNGADSSIIHINDLIDNPDLLDEYQILAIPGGFSYGDDTGSGNAFAQKMKLSLWDALQKFIARDTLTIGICNGCQVLANLGLIPGINGNYGERSVAVTYNASNRYQCRWVNLKVTDTQSPWLKGIDHLHIPVAHGEGRFVMHEETLNTLISNNQIAAQYIDYIVKDDTSKLSNEPEKDPLDTFPHNPNGSLHHIAAITDPGGKILAIMPHPERGMFTWQRDDYDALKDKAARDKTELPDVADGMAIFKNAVNYFKS